MKVSVNQVSAISGFQQVYQHLQFLFQLVKGIPMKVKGGQ